MHLNGGLVAQLVEHSTLNRQVDGSIPSKPTSQFMYYEATNPQTIISKFRECRFFLTLMADYEKTDPEKFSFCVSAFLCAFRSIQTKLLQVVEKQHGPVAHDTLNQKLRAHVEIKFLTERRNLEIHGDGVPLYKLQMLSPEDLNQSKTRVRIDPNILSWRIDNHPENPIVLFHNALNVLEQIVCEANVLPS